MIHDPASGEIWLHHKGNQYEVLFLTNTTHPSDRFPVTVVYRNIINKTTWSRPLSDWHRAFTQVVS